jgi:hypothetical protein
MLRKETDPTPVKAGVHPRIAPSRTIAVPATVEIPAEQMTIHAAPPALITRRNADYLGLSSAELLETLRRMRRDKRFSASVIVYGKLRAASPDAIVGFLRSVPVPAVDATPGDDDGTAKLYAELGLEAVPAPRGQRGKGAAR